MLIEKAAPIDAVYANPEHPESQMRTERHES